MKSSAATSGLALRQRCHAVCRRSCAGKCGACASPSCRRTCPAFLKAQAYAISESAPGVQLPAQADRVLRVRQCHQAHLSPWFLASLLATNPQSPCAVPIPARQLYPGSLCRDAARAAPAPAGGVPGGAADPGDRHCLPLASCAGQLAAWQLAGGQGVHWSWPDASRPWR